MNLKQNTCSMVKKTILFLFFVFLSNSLFLAESSILPTSLQISVIDELGSYVSGAKAALYSNESDYFNEANPLQEKVTDKKGRALFKKLEPKVYFLKVTKGNKTNDDGGTKTNKLTKARRNKVNIVIQ